MIGQVGTAPEKYWGYTLRESGLLAQAFRYKDELSWMQTRNIEYSNYATTFSMNGKKIFRSIKKPKDLYTLPSEERQKVKKNTAVFDLERAEKAYNQSSKKPKWLQQKN